MLARVPLNPAPLMEMSARTHALRSAVAVLLGTLALLPPASAESRGELLYATHCIACHTSAMHWRDNKAATDWSSLKTQVRRWQGAASLAWTEADILEVARYLNESIYRFEQTADPVTSLRPWPRTPVSVPSTARWTPLRSSPNHSTPLAIARHTSH